MNKMVKFLQNENYRLREIENISFLVDIKYRHYYENPFLLRLNNMSKEIWKLISKPEDIKTIAQSISKIIIDDIEISVIENDVGEFLNMMVEKGCVNRINV